MARSVMYRLAGSTAGWTRAADTTTANQPEASGLTADTIYDWDDGTGTIRQFTTDPAPVAITTTDDSGTVSHNGFTTINVLANDTGATRVKKARVTSPGGLIYWTKNGDVTIYGGNGRSPGQSVTADVVVANDTSEATSLLTVTIGSAAAHVLYNPAVAPLADRALFSYNAGSGPGKFHWKLLTSRPADKAAFNAATGLSGGTATIAAAGVQPSIEATGYALDATGLYFCGYYVHDADLTESDLAVIAFDAPPSASNLVGIPIKGNDTGHIDIAAAIAADQTLMTWIVEHVRIGSTIYNQILSWDDLNTNRIMLRPISGGMVRANIHDGVDASTNIDTTSAGRQGERHVAVFTFQPDAAGTGITAKSRGRISATGWESTRVAEQAAVANIDIGGRMLNLLGASLSTEIYTTRLTVIAGAKIDIDNLDALEAIVENRGVMNPDPTAIDAFLLNAAGTPITDPVAAGVKIFDLFNPSRANLGRVRTESGDVDYGLQGSPF